MLFRRGTDVSLTRQGYRVIGAVFAAALPGIVLAAQPGDCCPSGEHGITSMAATTGLGQAWPQTTDLSQSSSFHVYRFARGGVRYLQVNDAGGAVRLAVGLVNGAYFELPIGNDRVGSGSAVAGVTVYAGADVKIAVQTAPTGDLSWIVEVAPSQ